MTQPRGLEKAKITLQRIYVGRSQLRELGCDPSARNVEIVMGRELWANLHIYVNPHLTSSVRRHPDRADALLIFGILARYEPNLGETELRFRSELVL